MTLKELLAESGASVSATIEGDEGIDYKFTFSVVDDEVQCFAVAVVAGHEVGVAFGRERELEMFEKLSAQMGDVSNGEI
jgi:hypothetical protein